MSPLLGLLKSTSCKWLGIDVASTKKCLGCRRRKMAMKPRNSSLFQPEMPSLYYCDQCFFVPAILKGPLLQDLDLETALAPRTDDDDDAG